MSLIAQATCQFRKTTLLFHGNRVCTAVFLDFDKHLNVMIRIPLLLRTTAFIAVLSGLSLPRLDAQTAPASQTDAPSQSAFPYSIRINAGGTIIPNARSGGGDIRQMGVRITRNIGRHFKLEGGYSRMNGTIYENVPRKRAEEMYFFPEGNVLANRAGYGMLDLNAAFPMCFGNGRHTVQPGIAVSYCWGRNEYSTPEGPIISVLKDIRSESYFGLCPNLTYLYTFLNGSVSVGGEYMLRSYRGRPNPQHDVSIVAAFNF